MAGGRGDLWWAKQRHVFQRNTLTTQQQWMQGKGDLQVALMLLLPSASAFLFLMTCYCCCCAGLS